jgi:hypothetical protein
LAEKYEEEPHEVRIGEKDQAMFLRTWDWMMPTNCLRGRKSCRRGAIWFWDNVYGQPSLLLLLGLGVFRQGRHLSVN